jgi:hypothetical protein
LQVYLIFPPDVDRLLATLFPLSRSDISLNVP